MQLLLQLEKAYNISLTITAVIERLPQPFNDYNGTDSRKPHKTRESRRRNDLQRGSLYAGTAEKPYFKRFSGIEKVHRNSIKITVDLWWS